MALPSELNFSELRVVLLFTLFFVLFFKYLQYLGKGNPLISKLCSEIPGPWALPIFGNSLSFFFAGKAGQLTLQQKWLEKYGSTYRVWIGHYFTIATSDINHLKTIFGSSKTLSKGEVMFPLKKLFSRGLVSNLNVHSWRIDRKRLLPYFTNETVTNFIPIINQEIGKFVTLMKNFADGTERDVQEFFTYLSMKMVLKTEFDYDINWENRHKVANLGRSLEKSMKFLSLLIFLPVFRIKIFDYLIGKCVIEPSKKEFITVVKQWYENYLNSIKLAEENQEYRCSVADNPSYHLSFVRGSMALTKEGADENEIADELFETFSAAFSTVAVTNSFVALMIAMHPKIQKKLHQEIDEVFGDDDRFPDVTDCSRLTYLDSVIKETQRRFTLVPMLMRCTEDDIYLGKHFVPKGTNISISTAMVHLNPSLYPRPYEFNPENFNPENVAKRPQYSFLAFSAGARNCIGKKLAELELKLSMAALLRAFEFRTSMKMEDMKIHFGFIAYNDSGFPVSFVPRKRTTQLE